MAVTTKGWNVWATMIGTSNVSAQWVAWKAGVSRPTAKKYLDYMCEQGVVEAVRRQYRSNVIKTEYTWVGSND